MRAFQPDLFGPISNYLLELHLKLSLTGKNLDRRERKLTKSGLVVGSSTSKNLQITPAGIAFLEECRKLPVCKIAVESFDVLAVLSEEFRKLTSDNKRLFTEPFGFAWAGYPHRIVSKWSWVGLLDSQKNLTSSGIEVIRNTIVPALHKYAKPAPEPRFAWDSLYPVLGVETKDPVLFKNIRNLRDQMLQNFYKFCASFIRKEDIPTFLIDSFVAQGATAHYYRSLIV